MARHTPSPTRRRHIEAIVIDVGTPRHAAAAVAAMLLPDADTLSSYIAVPQAKTAARTVMVRQNMLHERDGVDCYGGYAAAGIDATLRYKARCH